MGISVHILKPIVTALFLTVAFSLPVGAQDDLDDLFAQLAAPELEAWEEVEEKIVEQWSRSGSASMDLLLSRGREALENGDSLAAIDHFSALTDHAPEFAEGWHARAAAFFQVGEYGAAIDDIQRALALNPRHFRAMAGLGIILEELEYHADALAAYRAANAIHPHRPEVETAIKRLAARLDGQDI